MYIERIWAKSEEVKNVGSIPGFPSSFVSVRLKVFSGGILNELRHEKRRFLLHGLYNSSSYIQNFKLLVFFCD